MPVGKIIGKIAERYFSRRLPLTLHTIPYQRTNKRTHPASLQKYTQTERTRACTADLSAARHRLVVQDREFPVNRLDPSPGPIYKPGAETMKSPTSLTEGWC